VPTGLVSAADSASKAIDLDWTPDVDPALAGYIVYRRAAATNEAPQRISSAGKPVTSSTWSDATATPGQRYAYSVSAIDLAGNESQRSTEVQDELQDQWEAPNSQPQPQSTSPPNQHP
jgi:fibronectin type 3 domain-containing protein